MIEDGYKVAALYESLTTINRVAEAYFYGIGMEQSDEQAYIWSKVIENIYLIFTMRKNSLKNN